MQGETKELWKDLCERAEVEYDSEKLAELVREINNLLEERQRKRMVGATVKVLAEC